MYSWAWSERGILGQGLGEHILGLGLGECILGLGLGGVF